jgi:ParB family transcriptional regulator, chromosome partitioning protein
VRIIIISNKHKSNNFMAKSESGTPKKRDYAAERARTKANKLKQQGGTDAQQEQEKPRKAQETAIAGQNMDIEQCGHIRIPLSQIVSDPNQPRKEFNQARLNELSNSIVIYDVIQPIMVRPIAGGLFMIVFGESRFRASLLAAERGNAITDIPAMVCEVSDEQALALQTIENGQRHDLHPMEEARTFKIMLGYNTIQDIALKVCKSEKFVAMRLMLNDLIPLFQEVFFANKMSIGQAVLLSKVSSQVQEAIYFDEVPDGWKENKDYYLDDIEWKVKQESSNLDTATFDAEDSELYPEAGACSKCPLNSANTFVMFVEPGKERTCGDSVCFNMKSAKAYKKSIEEVMTDPQIILVAGYHYDNEAKQKVKDVEKMGVTVLNSGSWSRIIEDEKPEWDKYKVERETDFNHEEITEEQFIAAIKPDFETEVAEWEKYHAQIEAQRSEGKVRKAFVVAGNGEGQTIEIVATTPQAELLLSSDSAGGQGENNIALQVAEIESREVRAKELDGENIWGKVRAEFIKGNYDNNDGPMSKIEIIGYATALYQSLDYSAQRQFASDVLEAVGEVEIGLRLFNISQKQFQRLQRALILSKLFPATGSHMNQFVNGAGFEIANECIPDTVKNIVAGVSVAAEKRAQRVAKKIEDLKNPPPPKAKKGEE